MATTSLATGRAVPGKPKSNFFEQVKKQKELVLITIPFIVYFFIFNYLPLWGLTMAFQNYKPYRTFWEQEWVGFKHFQKLFTDPAFYRVLRNTLAMSLINLAFSFITAIVFALLLNEIPKQLYGFKRVVQTISYMPHFLSWIIVCGLVSTILSMDDGIINNLLLALGLVKEKIISLGNRNISGGS